MERVLVTGGAGFIGSHLVERLVKGGHRVRVLDNLSSGKRSNLAAVAGEIDFQEGDIRDPEGVRAALRGMDVVFHQAAFVSVPGSVQDPQTCFEVNVSATRQLLEAAREGGVRRVVLASSSAVYGDNHRLPLQETADLHPLSPYAASKQVNEVYGALHAEVRGLDVVALRYFNVYGPRQNADSDYAAVIPIYIRQLLSGKSPLIYGDGEQTRDFVFVEDIARANLLAAFQEDLSHRVFNICTGSEVSLHDLLNVLSAILPGTIHPEYQPARPGDIYRSVGDPSRAAVGLKFEPETSLREGLERTLSWMRKP